MSAIRCRALVRFVNIRNVLLYRSTSNHISIAHYAQRSGIGEERRKAQRRKRILEDMTNPVKTRSSTDLPFGDAVLDDDRVSIDEATSEDVDGARTSTDAAVEQTMSTVSENIDNFDEKEIVDEILGHQPTNKVFVNSRLLINIQLL